ncbi:hypothetical protein QYF61_008776 [Mycteria americana]|uniref:Uncharacterized protein n=1 Tax=Mycteria americana TaxID=33587 RepID=A0AAN7MR53_MYCAM|nr:hypothetical protein QYF61_008776 [Mycteria americana]
MTSLFDDDIIVSLFDDSLFDDIIVIKKGRRIIQFLLKAGFAIKKRKVKGPAEETQFLGIKWQDGHRHIPMDVINKLTAMSPPTSKKATQAFLGVVSFLRMHIPGILEMIKDWPEGRNFGVSPEEVTCAEEAPLYNKLPENEKQYALFTDGSCHIVGKHRRWKAAVWSPIRQVVETAIGKGESRQFAEVKAIPVALDIAE